MIAKLLNFLKHDIWRIRSKTLPRSKSYIIQPLRISLLALRGFNEDKCQLRASALTFYTLLSIVPVVAMAFGIAKGFGFEKILEKLLLEKLPGQEEIVTQVIGFAHTFLENTKGGMIAGIGVAVLFWTIIKVLGNIETSFNDIWGIKKSRNLVRKFTDYLSIMLICPILLIIASSLTVTITSKVTLIVEKISLLGAFSPLIFLLLKLLPFAVIWVVFTFIYVFMPNTKVLFKSGLLGGIIAGTIYQIVQWAYITFQIGVAKFGAIYGSFAALPLFLVWLQISWLIVFLGAEIAFAYQNLETYEFEPDCLKISYAFKKLLTLRIVNLCIKNFCKGAGMLTAPQVSRELDLPIRLVRQIIHELIEAGIISETTKTQTSEVSYQPARCTDTFTVKSVIDALEEKGTANIPVADSQELTRLRENLKTFSQLAHDSTANMALRDI